MTDGARVRSGGEGPGGDRGEGRKPTFIEQARRRQIVDAAIETLAEEGYGGATFARIAARAGISPGLISYHFAGKQELMSTVVSTITASMDHAIRTEVEGAPSYRAVLRGLIETQVRYFAEHTTEVLALGHIFRRGVDDELSGQLESLRATSVGELEQMFREGQETGDLGPFPTRPMAVTLLAALEAVPAELLGDQPVDAAAYASALADIFDAAVRP